MEYTARFLVPGSLFRPADQSRSPASTTTSGRRHPQSMFEDQARVTYRLVTLSRTRDKLAAHTAFFWAKHRTLPNMDTLTRSTLLAPNCRLTGASSRPVPRHLQSCTGSLAGTRLQGVRAARPTICRQTRLQVAAAAAVEAPPKVSEELIDKAVNTIRFLSIDAVNAANSGHPGLPMVRPSG